MTRLNKARSQYVNKLLAEKSLYHYIQQGWQHIEPSVYQDNWHIKFIADHIQAFFANQFEQDYLLINIPPSFAKSLITSVWLTIGRK